MIGIIIGTLETCYLVGITSMFFVMAGREGGLRGYGGRRYTPHGGYVNGLVCHTKINKAALHRVDNCALVFVSWMFQ